MSNILKDIFSNDIYNVSTTLNFDSKESKDAFKNALYLVETEGKVVKVDGITSINNEIGSNGIKYPYSTENNISDFFVGPAPDTISFPVDPDNSDKVIHFNRSFAPGKTILETFTSSVVKLKITFSNDTEKANIKYDIDFSKANNLVDLINEFDLVSLFLNKMFRDSSVDPALEENIHLKAMKDYFKHSTQLFERLYSIERELNISFNIEKLQNLSAEDQHDIDELYILICKKQPVRLSATLTPNDPLRINNSIDNRTPNIGDNLSLIFIEEEKYSILDKSIPIYTVNHLFNAFVKDIIKNETTTDIVYDGTDSNPLYISFKIFKTLIDAEEEAATSESSEVKATYKNAVRINEHIKNLYR